MQLKILCAECGRYLGGYVVKSSEQTLFDPPSI